MKEVAKKIGFQKLYHKFKFKVIRRFVISTIRIIIAVILNGTIAKTFESNALPSNYNNWLIPEEYQKWLGITNLNINRQQFIIIGLFLVLIFAFTYYWEHLWEEELRVRGIYYTRRVLLNKFRCLPFAEKQTKKEELNNLIEQDSYDLGYYWEHLPNHIYHNTLTVIATLIYWKSDLIRMTPKQKFFSFFWLILIGSTVYWFTKKIIRNEEESRKRLDKEWREINKERNNIILIDSMGLSNEFCESQQKTSQQNELFHLNINRTKVLNKTIPNKFLIQAIPFLLLLLSGGGFRGIILVAFWRIIENCEEIASCLWDYADYASSRKRINAFLKLPEKNDNPQGIKLSNSVSLQAIIFRQVSFRYPSQKVWVLKDYNQTFATDQINYLVGSNGAGKSTILYLLLGILKTQHGQIIIELSNGQSYDLTELDLTYWRTNNVAYAAHETLLEKGSTGQKQLANINNLFNAKKEVNLWILDEADNAFDQKNQSRLEKKLTQLVKQGKIVIYVKH